MADLKLTDLPAVTALAATDLLYAVASGVSSKVTVSDLTRQLYGTTAITATIGGVERLRIDSSGNVGIGTSSLGGKLHVNDLTTNSFKALNITAGGAGADAGIRMSGAGGNAFRIQQPNTSAGLFFYDETNAAERMRLDASGNLGLGVTPSAWSWGGRAIDGTDNMVVSSGGSSLYVLANAFWNGTAWAYKTTSQATRYEHIGGAHRWFTAPSGTAGNPITFTQAMTLDASGNLGIGITSPLARADINGASLHRGQIYISQAAQTTKAAAATLTIAELLTDIIQYTGAAANLTLPTGTNIDAGLPASFPVDMGFDFSIINTGPGAATVVTNTGPTTVGALAVAAGASGMFRVRKTAANTSTVYRIS